MDMDMFYGMTFDATVSVEYNKVTFSGINATELIRLLSIIPKMTASNYGGRDVEASLTISVHKEKAVADGADK